MSNKIILKKSSVVAKVPLTSDLEYGELALNYADGKLYFKNSSNAVQSFSSATADTSSYVTLTGTQTLTNKTLTFPAIDNIKTGYTSTVAAGGITLLHAGSNHYQRFTGNNIHTVILPVTSTLSAGVSYTIENSATPGHNLTINSSGGNLVATVIPGTTITCMCIGTTLTTAADWDPEYTEFAAVTGTGSVVLNTNPTLIVTDTAFTLRDDADPTKQAQFQLSGITAGTTRTLQLPNADTTLMGTAGGTFNGAVGFNTTVIFHNTTASITASALTTGLLTLGGASGTGTMTFGQSTVSQTTNIQAGATASGSTKTLNIGTSGLSGSTTNIAIGSAVSGASSTTTVNNILAAPGQILTGGPNTFVRDYASGFSTTHTPTLPQEIGRLTLNGDSHNISIIGEIRSATGSTSGVTRFVLHIRSNTLPSKSFQLFEEEITNLGQIIRVRVYENTATGLVVIGYSSTSIIQNIGWSLKVQERGNYNYLQQVSALTPIDTTSLTEIVTTSTVRTLTGSLSVAGQLTSTVATGTAPLAVTSTTRVANLNVATAGTADTLTNALTIGTGLSGTSFNGSAAVTIAIDSTVATLTGTQTLTNKTIAAGSNTISGLTNANLSGTAGITNANLANSSVTIGSTAIALGASSTTIAGLTSVSSTSFTGDLTGNASTATTLQTARNINGVSFNGSADITINAVDSTARIASSLIGAANGVAPLDATSKISSTYLPSYVDDVLEYTNLATFPVTGETGKIYVALDTNKTYRWSGSAYIFITSGAVDSVAGKTGVVTLVKADVGLGNVDNTADSVKSVASATTAGSAATLTTARTINGVSFNGSADITVTANTTNSLTIGTGLSGTSFNGGSAVTIAIDSNVVTLTGTQTLTNKTIAGAAISGSLIPSADATYDLGSAAYKFKDLYLSGSSLFLNQTSMQTHASGIVFSHSTNTTVIPIGGGAHTLVTLAGTETLTNKTLTSPSLTGTVGLTSTTLFSINGNTGNNGQFLARGPTGLTWTGAPTASLVTLTDVSINNAQPQQVLTYTGSAWINAESNAVVASAVFATSQADLGFVYDSVVNIQENLGSVAEIAYSIYDLGVLSFTGIISLNNIDQSVKSDYIGYSIIFGF